jgi:hypothetical protein
MKCTNPFTIPNPNHRGDMMQVPCQYCLACRINKTSEWTFRILAELPKYGGKSCWETLTYDQEHVPLIDTQHTLRKKDTQDYHKRLRKQLKNVNFKYFLAGEYGERGDRPHYHIIYCGLTVKEHGDLIQKAWGNGRAYHGYVDHASIRYTVSYIMDKQNPIFYEPRETPFQLSSTKFAKDYLFDNIDEIIKLGYIQLQSGQKIKLPKFILDYYDYLIPKEHVQTTWGKNMKKRKEHEGWTLGEILIKEDNERKTTQSQLEWKAKNQPRQSI